MNIHTSGLTLADFTGAALLLPQLKGTSTTAVMEELSQALHQAKGIESARIFHDFSALNRELLTGRTLDSGAAFPQVMVPELTRACFALGRSQKPLPWRAKWLVPVDLVFLLAGPMPKDLNFERLRSVCCVWVRTGLVWNSCESPMMRNKCWRCWPAFPSRRSSP
jgi:mannitol/fructose-specific phosphotransferase system IIA component (Ntr-type)